ncbi:MAG TPA: hypothetical protein VGH87_00435, partial [Polyangiaceae bacterium]
MNLDVLFEGEIDIHRIAEVLDGLGHPGRVATIRSWGLHHQSKLYDAVKGMKPLTLDYYVPSDTEPMTEVIHWGKNSLPAFTHFQKRFCRPKDEDKKLYGYNENGEKWAVGPGYFVMHEPEEKRPAVETGELDIDYTMTPGEKAEKWPPIKKNEGLGKIVYGGMIDVMRGIS